MLTLPHTADSRLLGARPRVGLFSLHLIFFILNTLIFSPKRDIISLLHKFNILYAKTVFFLLRVNCTFFSHVYIVNLIKTQIPLCRCVNSVLHKFV